MPQDYYQLALEHAGHSEANEGAPPLEQEKQEASYFELAQQYAQEPLPLGFEDAMRETFQGGKWVEKIPFYGGAVKAERYMRLWEAADRLEQGTQTQEDEELVLAFLAEGQRKQGIGYMVGSILTELPGFMAEFAASGGVWSLGKKVGLKAMGKGLREGVERASRKASLRLARRNLREGAVGKAAAGTAAKGLGGIVDTSGQLAAMTMLGELAGGSRVQANAWRRALPELQLSETDAGRLSITFHSTTGDFVEELPAAMLDEFIELYSERSGGALMAGVSKIPGASYVAAMQADVAAWWAKKYPGRMGELLKTVATAGGWHGPLSEFLEERFGGALRGLSGVEEGGLLANAFPSLDQMAAELIAFSVPGVGAGALRVADSPGPQAEVPTEGFAKAEQPLQPLAPEERQAIVEHFGTVNKQEVEEVELPEGAATGERAQRHGLEVIVVQSTSGEELEQAWAQFPREGVVVIDAAHIDWHDRLLAHEIAHDLQTVNPEAWDAVFARLSTVDAESLEKFTAEYKVDYQEAHGKALAQDKEAKEGLSRYAEERAALLWLATTPNGRQTLANIVGNRRSALQAIRDWLARGLDYLGFEVRTTQERKLAALDRILMTEGTELEHLQGALILGEAINTMVGTVPPSGRPGPMEIGEAPQAGAPPIPAAEPLQEPVAVEGEPADTEPEEFLPEDKEPSAPDLEPPGPRDEAAPQPYSADVMLETGETYLTSSGRETAPVPKTGKTNLVKKLQRWLLDEAIAEAKARGDDYNLVQFEGEGNNWKELPPATIDAINVYLSAPPQELPGPITRPLVEAPIPPVRWRSTLMKSRAYARAIEEYDPGYDFGDVWTDHPALIRRIEEYLQDKDQAVEWERASEGPSTGAQEISRRLLEGEDLSKEKFPSRDAEEDAEMGVSLAAREIADRGMSRRETFRALVDLYQRQPRRRLRTSTTVLSQQYSTPLPLAYLAGDLAGVTAVDFEGVVYEPTAGHGLLLSGLHPDLWPAAILNELDEGRRKRLGEAVPDLSLSGNDAATWRPDESYDVVLANPPFGRVTGPDKKPIRWTYQMGEKAHTTSQIDHAIAAKALEGLPEDGRAVFIIGSQKSLRGDADARQKAREKAYKTGQVNRFFRELYANWNVTRHFTVSGDLYKAQGAAWPVDVIVVEGRGASQLEVPALATPTTLDSWDELEELLVPEGGAPGPGGRPRRGRVGTEPGTIPGEVVGAPGTTTEAPEPGGQPRGPGKPDGPGAPAEPGERVAGADAAGPSRVGDRGERPDQPVDGGADLASEGGEGPSAPALEPGVVGDGADDPGGLRGLIDGAIEDAYGPEEAEAPTQAEPDAIPIDHPDERPDWRDADWSLKRVPVDERERMSREERAAHDLADRARSLLGFAYLPPLKRGAKKRELLQAIDKVAAWWRALPPSTRKRMGREKMSEALLGLPVSGMVKKQMVPRKDDAWAMIQALDNLVTVSDRTEYAWGFILQGRYQAAIAAGRGEWDSELPAWKPTPDPREPTAEKVPKKKPAKPSGPASPAQKRKEADDGLRDIADLFAVPGWHGGPHRFKPELLIQERDGTTRYIVKGEEPVPEGARIVKEYPRGRFRTDKIGTGEGALAYGWGLYFASKKEVAEYYKHALGRLAHEPTVKIAGEVVDEVWAREEGRLNVWEAILDATEGGDTGKRVVEMADETVRENARLYSAPVYAQDLEWWEANRDSITVGWGGRGYQVSLAPSEDEYLLWDEPLSKQSEKVRGALEGMGLAIGTIRYPSLAQARRLFESGRVQRDAASDIGIRESLKRGYEAVQAGDEAAFRRWFDADGNLLSPGRHTDDMRGQTAYKRIQFRERDQAIDEKRTADTTMEATQRAASQALRSAGIRGVKYLDGSSRGKGEGSYNYVIFDEADVEITDLFAVPRRTDIDPKKYAKIRPAFEKKLEAEGVALENEQGIVTTIVEFFRDVMEFTKEQIRSVVSYIEHFVEEVREGLITWGGQEPRKRAPRDRKESEAEATDAQVPYEGLSDANPMGTLVPNNLKDSLQRALHDIAQEFSSVDDYLLLELGWTWEQLTQRLGREQADAVALSIRAFQKGRGFILADQTGVGKGRVVASLLYWARRQGLVPVFVTKDEGLFADMVRDLHDIGVEDFNPYVTKRAMKAVPLPGRPSVSGEKDGDRVLRAPGKKKHDQALEHALDTGQLHEDYNAIFTTYSQFTTRHAKKKDRHRLLEAMAPRSVWIMDEAHLAGGQKLTDQDIRNVEKGKKLPVSVWVRGLLQNVKAVGFSSATFAKNPTALTLYERTDLGLALPKMEDFRELEALIESGGVPLQQVLTTMFSEAGQLVRRERSFEGVEFNEMDLDVSTEMADTLSEQLRVMFDLDVNYLDAVRAAFREEILPEMDLEAWGDSGTGARAVENFSFGGVMHNVADQAMLALKAKQTAREAIKEWEAGRKPVIALRLTMGAAMERLLDRQGLLVGDRTTETGFVAALEDAMERLRRITLKDSDNNTIGHIRIEDHHFAELGMDAALAQYERVLEAARAAELGEMHTSPIDVMRTEMERAGMRVGELTGRSTYMELDDAGGATIAKRDVSKAQNKRRMQSFNAGKTDVLIINEVGSTGFSLHAGPKFRDQRRRVMLVAEYNPDINVFKQTLGRIHRTGQVAERITEAVPGRSVVGRTFEREEYGLPIFRVLFANQPSEQRAKAVLRRKMQALNANTTAAVGSADTLQEMPAFINHHGDRVAREVLEELPLDFVAAMGLEGYLPSEDSEGEGPSPVDLMKRLTGRMRVLPAAEQDSIYNRLIAGYNALIDHLNAIGENDLEAQVLELDARRISSKEVVPRDGPSPFQAQVLEERIDAVRLNPPLPFAEMQAKVREYDPAPLVAGVDDAFEVEVAVIERAQEEREEAASGRRRVLEQAKQTLEAAKAAEPKGERGQSLKKSDRLKEAERAYGKAEREQRQADTAFERAKKQRIKLAEARDKLRNALAGVPVGLPVRVEVVERDQEDGGEGGVSEAATQTRETYGVVTNLERAGRTKSALSPSDYVLTVYTSASTHPLQIPASRLLRGTVRVTHVDADTARKAVERERAGGREELSVLTGNLLRAYKAFGNFGRINMFRDATGELRTGLLLRGGVDVKQVLERKPLVLSLEQLQSLLRGKSLPDFRWSVGGVDFFRDGDLFRLEMGSGRGVRGYLSAFKEAGFELERPDGKTWMLPASVDRHSIEVLVAAARAAFPSRQSIVVEKSGKAAARKALNIEETDTGLLAVPRRRRGAHEYLGFDTGPERRLDTARRWAQDKDIRIKRFQEALRAREVQITDDQDVYRAIEFYPGRVETLIEDWERAVERPIMELLGSENIDLNDADLYLYARHAGERNEKMAAKHLAAWVDQAVKDIRNTARRAAGEAQRKIDTSSAYLKTPGLSDEARKEARADIFAQRKIRADALRRANSPQEWLPPPPADLPFQDTEKSPGSGMPSKRAAQYVKEYEEGPQGAAYRRLGELVDRMNDLTRERQRAAGLISSATADAWEEEYDHYVPLRSAVEPGREGLGQRFDTRHSESRAAWGRRTLAHSPLTFSLVQARRSILRGEKNRVGQHLLRLVRANRDILKDEFQTRVEQEELDQDGEQLPVDLKPANSEFVVKDRGKAVFVTVRDPLILRALQGSGDQYPGPLVRIFAWVNRMLSRLNTSLDPGFMFSNFTRDLQTAGINLAGEEGMGLAASVMGSTPKAVAAAMRGLRGTPGNTPLDASFQELKRAGGLTGWYYMRDFEREGKSVARKIADARPSKGRKVALAAMATSDYIEDMGRAMENGVRLAAYHHARAAGQPISQAASLAKNLTVNFNRRGEWGTLINSLYLFYNASVQGTLRMFSALRHPQVRRLAYGVTAGSWLLDIMNRALSDEDEDGVPFYDKYPRWIRDRNLILVLPGTGGDYLKIPLPYGYNIFHALGSHVGAIQAGKEDLGDALAGILAVSWESFYPLGSEASLAQSILPTLADPLVQIGENQTFYGAPIAKRRYDDLTPRSQLYWSSVNPTLRQGTEWLNAVTGGSDVRAGWADINPEHLEHMIEFAAGGFGRQLKRGWESGALVLADEPLPTQKIPILRRFWGEADPRFDTNRYIEQRDSVRQAERELKEFADQPEKLRSLREAEGHLIRLVPTMKKTESTLRKLRKARRLSAEAGKKERVHLIEARIRALQASFSEKYREVRHAVTH